LNRGLGVAFVVGQRGERDIPSTWGLALDDFRWDWDWGCNCNCDRNWDCDWEFRLHQ
jgi:hypothetical protein